MRYGLELLTLFLLVLGIPPRLSALAQESAAPAAAEKDAAPQAPPASDVKPLLPEDWVKEIKWRSIGPANMSGRITAIAVNEQDPNIWWAASASGGLLKTTNNGAAFEHQFDREATVSIGDVQVSKSNPDIVWVGSGEANPRNSASWGDGVYKSEDGGKTWKNMGLQKIFQTGRIAIHPENPDIVYVGALGRLWGPNEERGLYKTTDGGKTWKKVLYINDMTGVIDVQMHPAAPDTLLVAAYERQRDGFDGNDPAKKFGEGSGIYRTTDGGQTFTRMTQGLPTVKLGRIGLNYYRKDPNFVYAVIESEKIGQAPPDMPILGVQGEDAEVGARITSVVENGPAAKGGVKENDIIVSFGGAIVHSYNDLQAAVRRRQAGDRVEVLVSRNRETVKLEIELTKRPEANEQQAGGRGARGGRGGGFAGRGGTGGRGGGNPFTQSLGGQQPNLQDQQGAEGFNYGGIYRSADGGQTWERINTLNPRPMYYSQIRVDPSDNNFIYVLGTELYRSVDGGKTFTPDGHSNEVHVDHHAMWVDHRDGRHIILGNDGGVYVTHDRMKKWDHHNHVAIAQFYHVSVDSQRAFHAYGGLQDNGSWGGPSVVRNDSGPVNTDWYRVGSGDGFVTIADPNDPFQIYFESQNGGMGRIHLKTGERGFIRPRAERGVRYRFNWKTPFILSPHNTQIHYSAGNYVFRSVSKGDNVTAISPEISRTNEGAGSALSESPLEAGVLFAGTTDGGLWMTDDDGKTWFNLFDDPRNPYQESNDQPPRPESGSESETGAASDAGEGSPPAAPAARGRRGVGPRFAAMLKQSDANQDGRITKDELPERMQSLMSRFDKNQDGVIDEQELAALTNPPADPPADTQPPADRPPTPGPREEATPPPSADEEAADDEEEEQEQDESGESSDATQSDDAQQPDAEQEPGEQEPGEQESATPSAEGEAPAEKEPGSPPAGESGSQPAAPDAVSGAWEGRMMSENMPEDRRTFTWRLKLSPDGKVTGVFSSSRGDVELSEGKFEASSRRLSMMAEMGQFAFEFSGEIESDRFEGEMVVGGGQFTVPVQARRTAAGSGESAGGGERTSEDAKPIKDWLPGPRWVSSLEASRFQRGRCYMTLDGHRSNDDEPYVFVTENYGQTWRSIRANLPTSAGSTRVIREDRENQNVLYLGCEFSCWVSIDRGLSWTRLNSNLPTVAVHDFAQHAVSGEIVAGTHGRALWVADISLLRQFSEDTLQADAHLYRPNTVVRWRRLPERGDSGTRAFKGENPASDAVLAYSLGERARSIELTVSNLLGEVLYRGEELSSEPGLHVIRWDLTQQTQQGGRGGPAAGRGRFGRRSVPSGEYLVTLTVNGNSQKQTLSIINDPDYPSSNAAEASESLWSWLEELGQDE